jgi:transcriptional regulator with XRE-family HTH domain
MNIKDARIKHGLTQKQLSAITGIPERTIQNWEGGQRKCPDYVEKMVIEQLDRKFSQPDYKTILEELQEMIETDAKHLLGDAKKYAENVLAEIKDSIK